MFFLCIVVEIQNIMALSTIQMYTGYSVKVSDIFNQILTKLGFTRHIFVLCPQCPISCKYVQSEPSLYMRTDGQKDITKLRGAFGDFGESA